MRKAAILLIVFACITYGLRTIFHLQNDTEPLFIQKSSSESILNPKIFDEIVTFPYERQLSNQMFALLVFIDLERICPEFMDEFPYWVAPRKRFTKEVYDVLLFLQKEHETGEFWNQLYAHGLDESNVIFFTQDGRERTFTQFGIFKILHSYEKGIEFYDLPNDTEDGFQDFEKKLFEFLRQ